MSSRHRVVVHEMLDRSFVCSLPPPTMRSTAFLSLALLIVLVLAALPRCEAACSSCSSCKAECESRCAGKTMQFSCSSSGGSLASSCSCKSASAGELTLYIAVAATLLIPCVCLLACCCLCYALLTSPLGISLLIALFVLLNWLVSLVSIKGGFKAVFNTLFSNWTSLSTVQCVELFVPLAIALLSYVDIIWLDYFALVCCLALFGAEAWFFTSLFKASSVIPFVTGISTVLGGIIVLLTLYLAFKLYWKIRMFHLAHGFDCHTCSRVTPSYSLNAIGEDSFLTPQSGSMGQF
mgnify:CR=1 FL=1